MDVENIKTGDEPATGDPIKPGCVRCPACSFQFNGSNPEDGAIIAAATTRLGTAYTQLDRANALIEDRGFRNGRLVGALRTIKDGIALDGDALRQLARDALDADASAATTAATIDALTPAAPPAGNGN